MTPSLPPQAADAAFNDVMTTWVARRVDENATMTRLIKDLGSPKYTTRAVAQAKLAEMGDAALPYLRTGAKSPDAEVRSLCEHILYRIDGCEYCYGDGVCPGRALTGGAGRGCTPCYLVKGRPWFEAGDTRCLVCDGTGKKVGYPAGLKDMLGEQP